MSWEVSLQTILFHVWSMVFFTLLAETPSQDFFLSLFQSFYPQGYPQGALYKTLVLYRFAVFLLFFYAIHKMLFLLRVFVACICEIYSISCVALSRVNRRKNNAPPNRAPTLRGGAFLPARG